MDDEYSLPSTTGKMERLVYLFTAASWTAFPCVYLAVFRRTARHASCPGDNAAMADNIEAPSSPLPLPVGIAQQESAAAEEKQQAEDRQQRPVTEDRDATIEITRKKKASDGEKKKPRPPRKIKDQTSDSSHAAVSSNAAPQAPVESSRIAAPFNSDSAKRDNSGASWESRVKAP